MERLALAVGVRLTRLPPGCLVDVKQESYPLAFGFALRLEELRCVVLSLHRVLRKPTCPTSPSFARKPE